MGDPSARDFEVLTMVSLSLAGTATSIFDLSDRDNKETLIVKEEVTDDAGVFGEFIYFFCLLFVWLSVGEQGLPSPPAGF